MEEGQKAVRGKTENGRQKRKGWFSRWRYGRVDAQALLEIQGTEAS
jgi:hypothetical protein